MKTVLSFVRSCSLSLIHTFLAPYYVSMEDTDSYAQEARLEKGMSQSQCLNFSLGY